MCRISLICVIFLIQSAVSLDNITTSGPQDSTCVENCLFELQQKAPGLDASTLLSLGHFSKDNETLVCPKYDAQKLNNTCRPYRDSLSCFNKCPNERIKTVTMSGLAPLQLACIDRKDDFDRYASCLSQNCPSIQTECSQLCGSFQNVSKSLLELSQRIRGNNQPNSSVLMDSDNFTLTISQSCHSVECYTACSHNIITSNCGPEAYNLEIDTVWTIFSAMIKSMSSMGHTTPWPANCRYLQSKYAVPSHSGENETRSNSVQEFMENKKNITTSTTGGASGATAIQSSIFVLIFCYVIIILMN